MRPRLTQLPRITLKIVLSNTPVNEPSGTVRIPLRGRGIVQNALEDVVLFTGMLTTGKLDYGPCGQISFEKTCSTRDALEPGQALSCRRDV